MRRFWLYRDEDATGISGCGVVAEGVQFQDDTLTMRWRTEHTSVAIYKDEATLLAIHGHEGKTRIVWIDSRGGDMSLRSIAPENGGCARDHTGIEIRKGDLVLPTRLLGLESEPYIVVRAPEWTRGAWRISSIGWPDCGYGLGGEAALRMVVLTHPDRPPCPECGGGWEFLKFENKWFLGHARECSRRPKQPAIAW